MPHHCSRILHGGVVVIINRDRLLPVSSQDIPVYSLPDGDGLSFVLIFAC